MTVIITVTQHKPKPSEPSKRDGPLITEEMVRAGLDELLSFYPDDLRAAPEEAVRNIYGAMSALAPRPDALNACYDELMTLGRQLIELGRNPREFTYRPLVLCEIDAAATKSAGDGLPRYKPTDDFLELLAAMRAAKAE